MGAEKSLNSFCKIRVNQAERFVDKFADAHGAVAEVQKLPQTNRKFGGFAVVEHILLISGICGCKIMKKSAVPSIAYLFNYIKSMFKHRFFVNIVSSLLISQ